MLGQIDQKPVSTIFATAVMTLKFDVNIFATESFNEARQPFMRGDVVAGGKRARERSFVISGQRNEAFGKFRKLMPPHRRFAFLTAQMRARGDAANVLITGAILREQRQN